MKIYGNISVRSYFGVNDNEYDIKTENPNFRTVAENYQHSEEETIYLNCILSLYVHHLIIFSLPLSLTKICLFWVFFYCVLCELNI